MNFWEFVGIFFMILLWKNNYIWLLEIIGIVGKLWNCGLNYNLLICEFLRICCNIFGNFIVENNYIWVLKLLELLENFGIVVWLWF